MRTCILLFSLFFTLTVKAQISKQNTGIVITKTSNYCGGANPPKEIINEARRKKIPLGEKFYVIKGTCNKKNRKIVDTLIFDTTGTCYSSLKPGCYSIIDSFRFNNLIVDSLHFDVDCLKQLWEKPQFSFEVIKGEIKVFSFNIEMPCPYMQPCNTDKKALPM